MNTERNRFLVETMNICWHEFDINSPERMKNWCSNSDKYSGYWNVCIKCGEDLIEDIANEYDFDKWKGFGVLWEWSIKQSWFHKFVQANGTWYSRFGSGLDALEISTTAICPTTFANAIYIYLKNKSDE